MPIIDVTIYGKSYSFKCEEGEERHLRELAIYLDRKIRSIAPDFGAVDSDLIMLMAMTLADELNESSLEIARLRAELEKCHHAVNEIFEHNFSIDKSELSRIRNRIDRITKVVDKL